MNLVLAFSEIRLEDVSEVGGKNASLGHLYNVLRPSGLAALDGFCTTANAYRLYISQNDLEGRLRKILAGIEDMDVAALEKAAAAAQEAVLSVPLPIELRAAISKAHSCLVRRLGSDPALAVRSSATAEDLPTASFAGQHESFLNVRGEEQLIEAVHKCYASLFTARAIDYRKRQGFDQLAVSISVGIQPMVRSDLASAGVIFTLDPETGFRDAVVITGSYGLGETVVKGQVDPDEWVVFKPTLALGHSAMIGRRRGSKQTKLVMATDGGTQQERVSLSDQKRYCLTDAEVEGLARAAVLIEESYSEHAGKPQPMDVEGQRTGRRARFIFSRLGPKLYARPRNRRGTRAFGFIRRATKPC